MLSTYGKSRKAVISAKVGTTKTEGPTKAPLQSSCWAGITKRGATNVLIFPCIVDAELYTEHILKNTPLLFIRDEFTDGHRFQQDNDPKNTIRLAKQFMDKEGINRWKTPPESSDVNPIKHLWHELKHFLLTTAKHTTNNSHTSQHNIMQ